MRETKYDTSGGFLFFNNPFFNSNTERAPNIDLADVECSRLFYHCYFEKRPYTYFLRQQNALSLVFTILVRIVKTTTNTVYFYLCFARGSTVSGGAGSRRTGRTEIAAFAR